MWLRSLFSGAVFLAAVSLPCSAAENPNADRDQERMMDEVMQSGCGVQAAVEDIPLFDMALTPPSDLEGFELALLPEEGKETPDTPRAGRPEPSPEQMKKWGEQREEREKNLQMLQMWKIMNDAQLRDDQLDRFFPLMREMQKQESVLASQRHSVARSLRRELAKDKPDEAEVNKLTTQLIDVSSKIWTAKRDGMEKIMGLLEPVQKARFVLAVTGMERDVLEAIARVKMMGPDLLPGGLDREKFHQNMEQLQERLEKLRQELKDKGYPVDMNSIGN